MPNCLMKYKTTSAENILNKMGTSLEESQGKLGKKAWLI